MVLTISEASLNLSTILKALVLTAFGFRLSLKVHNMTWATIYQTTKQSTSRTVPLQMLRS